MADGRANLGDAMTNDEACTYDEMLAYLKGVEASLTKLNIPPDRLGLEELRELIKYAEELRNIGLVSPIDDDE